MLNDIAPQYNNASLCDQVNLPHNLIMGIGLDTFAQKKNKNKTKHEQT